MEITTDLEAKLWLGSSHSNVPIFAADVTAWPGKASAAVGWLEAKEDGTCQIVATSLQGRVPPQSQDFSFHPQSERVWSAIPPGSWWASRPDRRRTLSRACSPNM
jgi:hypothetical protein